MKHLLLSLLLLLSISSISTIYQTGTEVVHSQITTFYSDTYTLYKWGGNKWIYESTVHEAALLKFGDDYFWWIKPGKESSRYEKSDCYNPGGDIRLECNLTSEDEDLLKIYISSIVPQVGITDANGKTLGEFLIIFKITEIYIDE